MTEVRLIVKLESVPAEYAILRPNGEGGFYKHGKVYDAKGIVSLFESTRNGNAGIEIKFENTGLEEEIISLMERRHKENRSKRIIWESRKCQYPAEQSKTR
jgi:uncharacterized membrane-anchored protein